MSAQTDKLKDRTQGAKPFSLVNIPVKFYGSWYFIFSIIHVVTDRQGQKYMNTFHTGDITSY